VRLLRWLDHECLIAEKEEFLTIKKFETMTIDERRKIRQLTGWSDEICNAIGSMDEAQIYINANLVEKTVNGRAALCNPNIAGAAFNCRFEWLKEKFADFDKWVDYNNADLRVRDIHRAMKMATHMNFTI